MRIEEILKVQEDVFLSVEDIYKGTQETTPLGDVIKKIIDSVPDDFTPAEWLDKEVVSSLGSTTVENVKKWYAGWIIDAGVGY